MLQSRTLNVPFGTGIDEKIKQELLDPNANMLAIYNLRIDKTGSYTKRHGYEEQAVGIGDVRRMGHYRDAPIVITGHKLYSYSANPSELVEVDRVPEAVGKWQGIIQANRIQQFYDVVEQNNLIGIIYAEFVPDGGGTYRISIGVYEAGTLSPIISPTLVAITSNVGDIPKVRAVRASGNLVFLWTRGTNELHRIYVDTTTPVFSTDDIIATDIYGLTGPEASFDACIIDGGNYAVSYYNDTKNGIVTSGFQPTASAPFATDTISVTLTSGPVTVANVCNIGDTLWVAWSPVLVSTARRVQAYGLNPTTFVQTVASGDIIDTTINNGVTAIRAISMVPTGTRTFVAAAGNENNATPVNAYKLYYSTVDGTGGTVTTVNQRAMFRHSIIGKGFAHAGLQYLPIACHDVAQADDAQLQPTGFLIDISPMSPVPTPLFYPARPIVTVLPQLLNTENVSQIAVNSILAGNGQFATLYMYRSNAEGPTLALATFDFVFSNQWENDELDTDLMISGGMPSDYDGQTVEELGFLEYPASLPAPTINSGGGILPGTYSYVAVYEWTTATGNVVFSSPTPVARQVTYTNPNLTGVFEPPTLQITKKMDPAPSIVPGQDGFLHPVRIVLYRTKLATPTTYYRLPPSSDAENDQFLPSVFITDAFDDSQLGAPLYTQPGTPGTALPRLPPPSSLIQVVHRNRVHLVSGDSKTVWYSGQLVQGEQPWFNNTFAYPVPFGGPITALESMDGILYIFKRDVIFSVAGDGPADNGTGNDFSTPEELDIEVGCIEPRSIVVGPGGIFFQSTRGLWMLTHSRSVVYAGKEVEDTLKLYPVIVSANISDLTGCILWEATDREDSANGVTIVYDYVHDKWMIDRKVDEDGNPISGQAATIATDVYYWSTTNGRLARESTATHRDFGAWVTAFISTAWVKVANIEGYQRLRSIELLTEDTGEQFNVTINTFRDYFFSATQNTTFLASEIITFVTGKVQLRVDMTVQKTESVRFEISDAPPDSGSAATGVGPNWIGLQFEVGVKSGLYKLPTANSK